MRNRLTDSQLRAVRGEAKAYKLFDSGGLYLLVNPDGSRYWRFKYRFGGREKCISFGTYPEVSLQLARERRTEARRQVAAGINPSEARKQEKKLLEERRPPLLDKPDEAPGSAFEQWFVHQHGQRPNRFGQPDAELRTEIHVGEQAAQELRERMAWDQRHTSALWAWQAHGSTTK